MRKLFIVGIIMLISMCSISRGNENKVYVYGVGLDNDKNYFSFVADEQNLDTTNMVIKTVYDKDENRKVTIFKVCLRDYDSWDKVPESLKQQFRAQAMSLLEDQITIKNNKKMLIDLFDEINMLRKQAGLPEYTQQEIKQKIKNMAKEK